MVLSRVPWNDDINFEWDEYNESEIGSHGVTCFDVEECFENRYRVIPHRKAKSDPEKYGDRYEIQGQTHGGRRLLIIIQYKGWDTIRPITAYDFS